mmetsp:Transcript_40379/g.82625  ORF Transcript_40379/g.82625 Transcript_40379/m.82625 type:complete len:218 (+) Transcript_40379:2445-3098(+)
MLPAVRHHLNIRFQDQEERRAISFANDDAERLSMRLVLVPPGGYHWPIVNKGETEVGFPFSPTGNLIKDRANSIYVVKMNRRWADEEMFIVVLESESQHLSKFVVRLPWAYISGKYVLLGPSTLDNSNIVCDCKNWSLIDWNDFNRESFGGSLANIAPGIAPAVLHCYAVFGSPMKARIGLEHQRTFSVDERLDCEQPECTGQKGSLDFDILALGSK